MKYIITFCLLSIFVGTFAEDPICKEKQRFANPRECCLDPKLITFDIIEKCRSSTGHMSEPNTNENMITEETPNNIMQYDHDPIESQLSIKPSSIGYVSSNGIKRDTRTIPKRKLNPFDLDEYGDSDEKFHITKSSEVRSDSSFESTEERPKIANRNKNYKNHQKCHHKSYHGGDKEKHFDSSSSSASNSVESFQHRKHHKNGHRHKHHCDHHKHHHGGHHCTHHGLKKFACFTECVFNETGFIVNKTINMNNVNTYLTEVLQLNDEYLPIVTDAFEICGKNVAEMRQKIKDLPIMPMMPMMSLMPHQGYKKINSQTCKPWAGYLMMCVKAQIFINCPIEDFRNDSIRCVNTRNFMKTCPTQSARIPNYFSNM